MRTRLNIRHINLSPISFDGRSVIEFLRGYGIQANLISLRSGEYAEVEIPDFATVESDELEVNGGFRQEMFSIAVQGKPILVQFYDCFAETETSATEIPKLYLLA